METIITKWVCVKLHDANKNILSIGKTYDIIKEITICPVTNIDLSITSFIADDGQSYTIHADEQINMNFISLEQYRQEQLNKIL